MNKNGFLEALFILGIGIPGIIFQQRGFPPDKQVWREIKCNARGLPWVKALRREWRTKFFCSCVNIGAYHSTKNFEIFETGTNCTEIPWEKFQKLLNFRKANHSTENSRNSGMKVKWNGNFQEKFFENVCIPHEVALFSGIYANSPFSTQR